MFIIVCDLPSDECAAAKLQRLREGGDAGPWVRFCLRCLRVRVSIVMLRRYFVSCCASALHHSSSGMSVLAFLFVL